MNIKLPLRRDKQRVADLEADLADVRARNAQLEHQLTEAEWTNQELAQHSSAKDATLADLRARLARVTADRNRAYRIVPAVADVAEQWRLNPTLTYSALLLAARAGREKRRADALALRYDEARDYAHRLEGTTAPRPVAPYPGLRPVPTPTGRTT